MLKKVAVESAAEAYLELLASRGVEYFFGNAGTDFAPIIEAYAKRAAEGQVLPRAITVPHEITAIGMAHGYAMVTGRPDGIDCAVEAGAIPLLKPFTPEHLEILLADAANQNAEEPPARKRAAGSHTANSH